MLCSSLYRFALVALASGTLLGCNREETRQTATPVADAKVADPALTAAAASPAPSADKTFTHSTLGFAFAYPDALTLVEDAKGVTLSSATLAKVTVDRSDRSKGPEDVGLSVRVTLEDGALVLVAKKMNPYFGKSFPDGTAASFKEEEGYAEKVSTGSAAAYRFTIGSHGSNQQDTFVPATAQKTLVVRCSFVGDGHNPAMSEESQLDACKRIVATLER